MNVFWLFLNQFYVFHTFVTCPNYFNHFPLCLLESELSALPDPKVQSYVQNVTFWMFFSCLLEKYTKHRFFKKTPEVLSSNWRALASIGEQTQGPCRATGEHWRALASKWSCWVSYRFFTPFALFQVFWLVLCVFPYFACYFMFCMCFIVFAGFVLFLRRYAKNNVRTVAIDVLGYFFPCGLFFDES